LRRFYFWAEVQDINRIGDEVEAAFIRQPPADNADL
jgi:hypothetical protein